MRGYENAKGHVLLKPERPKQIKAKKEKGLNTRGHLMKMKLDDQLLQLITLTG